MAAAIAASSQDGGARSVEAALRERLEAKLVSVSSIACLDSGVRLGGAVSYRCTVNFGDPHLVPYCAARVGGEVVTDRERPELRCYPPEDEERYRENALLPPR